MRWCRRTLPSRSPSRPVTNSRKPTAWSSDSFPHRRSAGWRTAILRADCLRYKRQSRRYLVRCDCRNCYEESWSRRLPKQLHPTGLEIVNATGDLNFARALEIAQDRAEFANARHRQPDIRLADGFDEFAVL